MTKRTFGGTRLKAIKVSGFRARMSTKNGQKILATGGGAFMNEEVRADVAASGVSVWLSADLDILMKRVQQRNYVHYLYDMDIKNLRGFTERTILS